MDTSTGSFSATVEGVSGDAVVMLLGELDLDTAPELAGALEPLLDDGPPRVVIECSGLGFIDSSGIAVLVAAQTRLQSRDAHLTLRSLKPHTFKIFAMLGLIEFMKAEAEQADHGNS